MASCRLTSSLTRCCGQEPLYFNLSYLPFFKLVSNSEWFSLQQVLFADAGTQVRGGGGVPTLVHSNWLNSYIHFLGGYFHELNLAWSYLFAFDLTCWLRGSVYFLSLQKPCLGTLPSRGPKEAATLSGQQTHLKVHEQCVQRKLFPSMFPLAYH